MKRCGSHSAFAELHGWNRFGPMFASNIRRKRVQRLRTYSNWQWNLDEMYVEINGEIHYLWRAVDHEGEVLESVVTKRRDKQAALKLLRILLRRNGNPETIVTDKMKPYGAALRELGVSCHETDGRWINNRAKNSHLPQRRRERAMQRLRQMQSLQKFAVIHGLIHNHFNQNVISTAERTSSKTEPPRLPSGGNSVPARAGYLRKPETGSSLPDSIPQRLCCQNRNSKSDVFKNRAFRRRVKQNTLYSLQC